MGRLMGLSEEVTMIEARAMERQVLALIIDPDPVARALVRQVIETEFAGTVLDAHDAISGLDLVQQRGNQLTLIVLELTLPDLDGYEVCLRIHDIGAQRRPWPVVLPYTAAEVNEPLLTELGCASPCSKPATVTQIGAAIRQAFATPPRPLPSNPLLTYAGRRAAAAEQRARQKRCVSIALLASALPARWSLMHLLFGTGVQVVAEAPSVTHLEHLLERRRAQLLVADAGDRFEAVELAARLRLPVLLVATAVEHRQLLVTDIPLRNQAQGIVDATTDEATTVLSAAIAALSNDEHYVHLPPRQAEQPIQLTVPCMVVQLLRRAGLTRREQELLWLDLQGWTSAQIAAQMLVTERSIRTYWKRAQRKLGMDRAGTRAWMRQQVQGFEQERTVGSHQ
jgi:DNA-binding NarL/FixJ family response regulator